MRARLIAALLVLVTAAACGVRSTGQAATAGPDRVPYDLLAPEGATTTTTLPELASRQVQVWLVAEGRILGVNREVATPVRIGRVVDALLAGPTDAEVAVGLRSAIPGDDVVREAVIADGVATIDLVSAFADAPAREQLLALAQLVYTATGLADVYAVAFELDGVAVDVPRADGSLSNGPVTRFDYLPLIATG
ncbi:MAG TPA: GerMN domain-containing protein [Acidimicrobiales bacterium]|nr:GerMN domain-containing protein [Acidimicrobiales bacterium]